VEPVKDNANVKPAIQQQEAARRNGWLAPQENLRVNCQRNKAGGQNREYQAIGSWKKY